MARALAAESVFRAIADPTRRSLLDLLEDGERAVGDLVERLGISQPLVSKHLRILRDAGLVLPRRAGRNRFYALRPAPLREVAAWIGHYERFWGEKLSSLDDYLDRNP